MPAALAFGGDSEGQPPNLVLRLAKDTVKTRKKKSSLLEARASCSESIHIFCYSANAKAMSNQGGAVDNLPLPSDNPGGEEHVDSVEKNLRCTVM